MERAAWHGRDGRSSRRANGRGTLIGLDLGATAVRAAVLAGSRQAALRLGSVPLPAGAIVRGVVQEPQVVTAALRRLAAEHRLRGRRVVVGVSTPQVVVRPLTLPAMPPDKLRLALPFQAREVLPIPVADAVLDFSPLPADDASGQRDPRVVSGLLTAAPRTPVMAMARAVERAGLSVARVDLASFGLLRSIGSAGPTVEALVDIGSELTTIVIHRHGIPHVVRVVAFGGQRLTERVADALGIGATEAEAAKRAVGVIGDSVPALQVRDELRALLAEIRASLQYFVTSVGSVVDRVLLTGGTAGMPGLAALLGSELGIAVDIATPLRHLGLEAGSPGLAGSAGGLVRRAAGPGGTVVLDGRVRDDMVHDDSVSAVSVGLALGAA